MRRERGERGLGAVGENRLALLLLTTDLVHTTVLGVAVVEVEGTDGDVLDAAGRGVVGDVVGVFPHLKRKTGLRRGS